jgi:predicted kinase
MAMKLIILVRGLPGSGKSTLAKTLATSGYHFEADMFFMKDGVYKFEPDLIENAHDWCRNQVQQNMAIDLNLIVVSNTFTMEWEMMPYIALAKEYGYMVHTIIVENRHKSENIHDCPKLTIDRMRARFEISL